jgi:hypothetical protein
LTDGERGEIDREGYLDLKVDDATAHLQGLHPEELDAVKTILRVTSKG